MKTFKVTFIEYYTYEVEIENNEDMDDFDLEEQAVDKAFAHYEADKHYPVANTAYDDVEVEEVKQ